MGNLYVRSTDGSDADNGTTWPLAKATITGAAAIDAAGDRIFVSQAHAETTAAAINFAFAGTWVSPTLLICGNDGAEPPAAVAATATVSTTGASNITIPGLGLNCYGITFSCGTLTGSAVLVVANVASSWHRYEQCGFILGASNAGNTIRIGVTSATNVRVDWKNCSVKFSNVAQSIQIQCAFWWNGGGVIAGGSSPTTLITSVPTGARALIENVDLSSFAATLNLCTNASAQSTIVFRDCKLPANWSGNLLSGSFTLGGRIALYNCDSGGTNYKAWIEDYAGTIRDETTLVRTGGASDGVTPLAWKMVSSANTSFPLVPLASDEMVVWNDETGVAKTVTVEIMRDSAANLTDAEVWLEVNYLGAAGSPLGTLVTDAAVDVLATPADQAASSVTWTTTGMSNPNKQKLSVTFTPQQKGFFIARVMLAKASTTVYVDPRLTVA